MIVVDLASRLETANPVLLRELGGVMQGRWFHFLVTGFALVLLLVTISSWESWDGGGAIFIDVFRASLVLVILVVPTFALGTVTGERASGTLEQLVVAPLTAREVVDGKSQTAMAVGMFLVPVTMPFASALYLLGGLPLFTILLTWAILVTTGYLVARVAVLASTLAGRTWQSAMGTYLFIAMLIYWLQTLDTGRSLMRTAFIPFLRLITFGPRSYEWALTGFMVSTILLAAARRFVPARSRWPWRLLLLLAVIVILHDWSMGDFFFRSYGPSIYVVSFPFLVLRSLWITVVIAGTLVGMARWWRIILPLTIVLLAVQVTVIKGNMIRIAPGPGTNDDTILLTLFFLATVLGQGHLAAEWAASRLYGPDGEPPAEPVKGNVGEMVSRPTSTWDWEPAAALLEDDA